MVVNGSAASDWDSVADLAKRHSSIIPSFGWHPWYLHEQQADWLEVLEFHLLQFPNAAVGEIGLDRWILEQSPTIRAPFQPGLREVPPAPLDLQTEVFRGQLSLASRLQRPATIHCLQAWGKLVEVLRTSHLPKRGFLLHSYGGSSELIPLLSEMGAYFSFPGYFAHDRKKKQREVFRSVPMERLLVESDAPDQLPPPDLILVPMQAPASGGRPPNHPANLPKIYSFLAKMLRIPLDSFAHQVEQNYFRLFGTTTTFNEAGVGLAANATASAVAESGKV